MRPRYIPNSNLIYTPKIVLIFRENLLGHSESTLLDSRPPHHVTFFTACDFWPVSYVISKHSNVNVGIYTGIFHSRFVAFRINLIRNRNLETNVDSRHGEILRVTDNAAISLPILVIFLTRVFKTNRKNIGLK